MLEKDTATLLHRTLRFSAHTASDVMTPRPRVASISRTASAQAVLELAQQTGYSRFPVVDDGIDDVSGIVHVKQAVAVPRERRADVPVSALQSDAVRVPETMKLDDLLGELRARGYQMAVVVDEYGGTAGVVTLEDLVEELVGEVDDEHDRARAGVVLSSGSLTFPGMLRPDELLERTNIVVPEDGPYETVAGYVMSVLGRLPVVGDVVRVDTGELKVERLDGRRIDRLRYTPDPEPEPEPEPADEPREPSRRSKARAEQAEQNERAEQVERAERAERAEEAERAEQTGSEVSDK